MSRHRRKTISLVAALSCAYAPMALVAPAAAQDASCAGTPVEVTVDDWSSGDRVEYMQQVVAEMQKRQPSNPDVAVMAEYVKVRNESK